MRETLFAYYFVNTYLYSWKIRENRQMGRPKIHISKEAIEREFLKIS